MEWIVFFLILALALLTFPRLLRSAKSSSVKGGMGGVVMAVGMAFTVLLDPAKKAAIENLEKEKETGNANADAAGDPEK
jgi:hypothetical protein